MDSAETKTVFPEKDLLEVEEVAEYLGVKQTTIYRWCREERIACFKIGKSWRIRPSAVEEFLRERERPATLVGQLRQFLDVPASVVGVAQNAGLLHRLDAAFFQVGAERGGCLVKFYDGGSPSPDELREDFESHGLDASRLEGEGRLLLRAEEDPAENREDELRRLVEDNRENGRSLWVSFNWVEDVDLDSVMRKQQELARFVSGQRLVIKTALLEEVADGWPIAGQRRAQAMHSGLVWLSDSGLALSRVTPVMSS